MASSTPPRQKGQDRDWPVARPVSQNARDEQRSAKMTPGSSTCRTWAVILAAATILISGCEKKDDAISQAEKKDRAQGIAAPSIAETKAIAEEGFIYGL